MNQPSSNENRQNNNSIRFSNAKDKDFDNSNMNNQQKIFQNPSSLLSNQSLEKKTKNISNQNLDSSSKSFNNNPKPSLYDNATIPNKNINQNMFKNIDNYDKKKQYEDQIKELMEENKEIKNKYNKG